MYIHQPTMYEKIKSWAHIDVSAQNCCSYHRSPALSPRYVLVGQTNCNQPFLQCELDICGDYDSDVFVLHPRRILHVCQSQLVFKLFHDITSMRGSASTGVKPALNLSDNMLHSIFMCYLSYDFWCQPNYIKCEIALYFGISTAIAQTAQNSNAICVISKTGRFGLQQVCSENNVINVISWNMNMYIIHEL